MTSPHPTLRTLFAQRRDNPIHRWMTRGRNARIGFILFLLLLLGAVASSLAMARQVMIVNDPIAIGMSAFAIYCLYIPLLMAVSISLACRPVSPVVRQEIWVTALHPREIAFGLLLAPVTLCLLIVTIYPFALAVLVAILYADDIWRILAENRSGDLTLPSIVATAFFAFVYAYYCAASAYIPLLWRIRSFPFAWIPTLLGPIWAVGHFLGCVVVLMQISDSYSIILASILGPGRSEIDATSDVNIGILFTVLPIATYIALRSVTARAGLRWLGAGVPHAAAEVDWAFHDRQFAERSAAERKAAWSRFIGEANAWWRPRLKWAAIGLALALAPSIAGLTMRTWADFRSLGWGGLFVMPLLIPAVVFMRGLIADGRMSPPLLPGRLLASSLVTFAPCAAICLVGVVLGFLLIGGHQILIDGKFLIYAVFYLAAMSVFFIVPCYVAWLALMAEQGRRWLLRVIAVLFALHVPAAMGLWHWTTLPPVILVGALHGLVLCSSLMGGITLLLQRAFILERRSESGARD